METYEVIGYVEMEDGTQLPIFDIPMMSDDRWNELCLKSRLEHPEYYEDIENVSEEYCEDIENVLLRD